MVKKSKLKLWLYSAFISTMALAIAMVINIINIQSPARFIAPLFAWEITYGALLFFMFLSYLAVIREITVDPNRKEKEYLERLKKKRRQNEIELFREIALEEEAAQEKQEEEEEQIINF